MSEEKDRELRKYLNQKFDALSQTKKLASYKNAAGLQLFESHHETYQVNIIPDKSVARAKFIPDPLTPGRYRAHPVTIKAMRKELFMGGEDFIDLQCLYRCYSCNEEIDLQFWHICPFCEAVPKI